MRTLAILITTLVIAASAMPARAADDSKVKAATREVETGAKKIGDGKIGAGVDETARGVGKTVAAGAKYTGERFKEGGKAAEPQAKSAWAHLRDGAVDFGHSVRSFFTKA